MLENPKKLLFFNPFHSNSGGILHYLNNFYAIGNKFYDI
jgi:hypothetical protein